MKRPADIVSWILLATAGAITITGVVAMLQVRFSTGDVYGIYSSHRADPLGTRALYEALARMPGVTCERNYRPIKELQGAPGDVLLIANAGAGRMPSYCGCDKPGEAIEKWAAAGGRVIITLQRTGRHLDEDELKEDRRRWSEEQKRKKEEPDSGSNRADLDRQRDESVAEQPDSGDDEDKTRAKTRGISPQLRYLGCHLRLFAQERQFVMAATTPKPPVPARELPLKESDLPPWYSNTFLKPAPDGVDQWKVLASKGNRPVIMERKTGRGSMIVCTDSFFLSNEALWREPSSAFLAWLIGDARRVVFEERLHGSGEDDGIMALARRYRMHGLFLGGLLLFALFVWRNAFSLVPPDDAADLGHWRSDAVAGQGAASGLVSLLKRGVKPRDLLDRCFTTWEATRAATAPVPARRIETARAILTQEKARPHVARHVASAYRKLSETLHPPRT